MIFFGFHYKIFYPLHFISNIKSLLEKMYFSILFISMTPPKICSMDENNSQPFGNLISQQANTSKFYLPPSAVREK